jgi:hypothetical protein
VEEFLRRWVHHVLPRGFVKIRHDGLLANRGRSERLALCRALLALWTVVQAVVGVLASGGVAGGTARAGCPVCGSAAWRRVAEVAPAAGSAGTGTAAPDTS